MNKEYTNKAKHKCYVELVITCLILTGCGSGSNDSQNGELNTTEQSVILAGNVWSPQQCETENEATEYYKLLYEFTLDGSVKLGRQYYDDSDCMIKSERTLPVSVGWLYAESGQVTLEDGTQGEGIRFDKSGEIFNGYYTISESNTLCFSYSLGFTQNEVGVSRSNAIDYDHCLAPVESNESEENNTMLSQEDIIKDYLNDTGWQMETTNVRPSSTLDIPNCSFFSVSDTSVMQHISSIVGITVNGEIIGINDPNVVAKVLSVNNGINSLSAGDWAELLIRFVDIERGRVLYQLDELYTDKFEQAGVEFVAPELVISGQEFSLHYFIKTYETHVVLEIDIEIMGGLITKADDELVASFTGR